MNHLKLEVIHFFQPHENEKNLYITNIGEQFCQDVEAFLFRTFSRYGLIYEIQVVNCGIHQPEYSTKREYWETERPGSHYAFVKFYSCRAAAEAIRDVTGRLVFNGQLLKIKFAKRRQNSTARKPLYVSKCHDLVNYYLGFNGYSTDILQNSQEIMEDKNQVNYVAGVLLKLPLRGLKCEGWGTDHRTFTATDPSSRAVAVCRAQKEAYRHAIQNAFSSLVLVVLADGRVYPEVNTTVEGDSLCRQQVAPASLLKVTHLETDPKADSDQEPISPGTDRELDIPNEQILQNLCYD